LNFCRSPVFGPFQAFLAFLTISIYFWNFLLAFSLFQTYLGHFSVASKVAKNDPKSTKKSQPIGKNLQLNKKDFNMPVKSLFFR
jgi:hypothetical protein